MTPLVDLAFLLLTFFLLHAGMAKPRVMQLTLPVEEPDEERFEACHLVEVMTILLGRNHRLHYYYGLNNPLNHSIPAPTLYTAAFGPQGSGQVLLARQHQLPEPLLLIKPATDATYRDVVGILDEMNSTSQKKCALVEMPASDTQLLRKSGY